MSIVRANVLTVAGFDPSGGAGVLADCKTFEMNKVQGFAITTCVTYQTEKTFLNVDWLTNKQISQQIEVLLARHRVDFVKIGLVENLAAVDKICKLLLKKNPKVKIIWDPILKASAGFEFHAETDRAVLLSICSKIFMITPNWLEITKLVPELSSLEAGAFLAESCMVYLKGGHNPDSPGKDYLFKKEKDGQIKQQNFKMQRKAEYDKHGSGCVLSSALLANIARGYPLIKACLRAKEYTLRLMESNKTLLGYHYR